MPTFGLVDCNNFYASCERVFRPDLRGLPVIILSNNDGCAIARNGGSLSQAPLFAPAEQQSAQGWRDGFDYCKARPR